MPCVSEKWGVLFPHSKSGGGYAYPPYPPHSTLMIYSVKKSHSWLLKLQKTPSVSGPARAPPRELTARPLAGGWGGAHCQEPPPASVLLTLVCDAIWEPVRHCVFRTWQALSASCSAQRPAVCYIRCSQSVEKLRRNLTVRCKHCADCPLFRRDC